MENVISELN